MSASEYPTSDSEEIKQSLREVKIEQEAINARLDRQAEGINAIGANLDWLVQNVQGIFQMFASPAFMSQMTNMLMGGIGNAGGQDAASGTPEGTNGG